MTNIVQNVAVEAQNVTEYVAQLNVAFDARIAYQRDYHASESTDNLVKKLNAMRRDATHEKVAQSFLDRNIDANFVNRQERANARFNEKAIVKAINLVRSLLKVDTINIYTRAIVASLVSFEQADLQMTQRETKAACSADAKLADSKRNKLVKRVAKIYDASTASTQSSSSNQVLLTFNIIRETKNAANENCFVLNRDNQTTQDLLALIAV